MTTSINAWRHGVETGANERLFLRAGPLSMVFEPAEAFLRYVRLGQREILRGVYAAVRDHNWDTITPQISAVELEQKDGGFSLSFVVACREGDVDFSWQGRIEGRASGSVQFSFSGVANADFRRNRIGFCVLHAAESAGAVCKVEKVDGTWQEGVLPVLISPQQPYMDVKSISHEVEDGVWAKVSFAGDIFEMEDQRNWTDASYKTYCTPLGLPFPVDVKAGDKIEQCIGIEVEGDVEHDESDAYEVVRLTVGGRGVPLMRLGVGMASDGLELTAGEIERLRALNLSHLRVDLHLRSDAWRDLWRRACAEAASLGVALEVAVFVDDRAEGQLEELAAVWGQGPPPLLAALIFHEDEKSTRGRWLRLAREKLIDCGVLIGAGSNAYFTELNRERPPVEHMQLVVYSLNPQVHAFDDASLVETLSAQALTAQSARAFCGDLPLAVSPVTLQPRFNPNATGPESETPPGQLPVQVDRRQMSLFAAAWTAISLKYLGLSALHSATYYETSGWRGAMERGAGSPLPEQFQSTAGAVFPLYHVLADVGEFAGGRVVPVQTSDALRADALMLEKGDRVRLLLANMTAEKQAVVLQWTGLKDGVWMRVLDEDNVERAVSEVAEYRSEEGDFVPGTTFELDLSPFAVVRLDGEKKA